MREEKWRCGLPVDNRSQIQANALYDVARSICQALARGGPTPAAVHYVTTGAGSDTRDDVDRDASKDSSLKFAYGATPGFVVLRATLDVLRITHHAAPGLLHTEEIWRK